MKSKNHLRLFLGIVCALFSSKSWAVPIGIVDSGTDLQHPDLLKKAWNNPGHLVGDFFTDDVHGWNFADKNNEIIDYSYLGKFSPEMTRFFQVQLKLLQDTASEDDIAWLKSKKADEHFIQELEMFGNFVHGTHVAGISAHNSDQAQIMAAKIIPTRSIEAPSALSESNWLNPFSFHLWAGHPLSDLGLTLLLDIASGEQAEMLSPVGAYLHATGMAAANCSFGTSVAEAKKVVTMLAKNLLKRELSEEEQEKFGTLFVQKILQKGASFVTSAPGTLFVIAAGNDGTDNDQIPMFPANLKYDNTITVAATRGYDKLASFSNYGSKMVDIAAPGVGIISDIPGGETMPLSGTSQAAPFITNLAGRIMDVNPKLSLREVKQILMQTVDKKSFLIGKVTSEGIANPARALSAANFSTRFSVMESIDRSKQEVGNVKSMMSVHSQNSYDGEPIPMPSIFLR